MIYMRHVQLKLVWGYSEVKIVNMRKKSPQAFRQSHTHTHMLAYPNCREFLGMHAAQTTNQVHYTTVACISSLNVNVLPSRGFINSPNM